MSPLERRVFSVSWPLRFEVDPEEQEQARREQIVYMARYARGPLTWDGWWDVDLEEFRDRYHDLSDMIGKENAATRAGEGT